MDVKFFDSLFEGDSPNGVKLGMGLTGGDFWPCIAGCSALYRGASMETVDFANILATTGQDATEILLPTYFEHSSSSSYFYVVRRANGCGEQEHTLAAAIEISIDANGDLAEPRPNSIFEAKVKKAAGNRVRLVWYYCSLEQESEAASFKVYYDARMGTIDYEACIAAIDYEGRRFYSYQSDALDAGEYLFALRVEDTGGVRDNSLSHIQIQVGTSNPNAVDIIGAGVV